MNLFPPEPDIKLYEQGFDGNDVLDRAETGKKLSELVEKIEDPIVIALDGSWGSGKTHFLKCWVGAHTLENGGTARTIYFDAFEHDFMDDPLIALTGVIAERFEAAKDKRAQQIWQKVKNVAPALGRAALRVGVSAATVGVVNMADEMGDAVAGAIGDELKGGTSSFWRREDVKRAAMTEFRTALKEMTKPKNGETDAQKIVIVIDELDRCRPDYALAMLEVMKHFFSVPNVHFVLGVNLKELENSVRARYGAGVNAEKYLQKFHQVQLSFGDRIGASAASVYFEKISPTFGIDPKIEEYLADLISLPMIDRELALRDVQRILTHAVLLPSDIALANWPIKSLVTFAIILRVIDNQYYSSFRNRTLKVSAFENIVGIDELRKVTGTTHGLEAVCDVWLSKNARPENSKMVVDGLGRSQGFVQNDHRFLTFLERQIAKYLDSIQLSADA